MRKIKKLLTFKYLSCLLTLILVLGSNVSAYATETSQDGISVQVNFNKEEAYDKGEEVEASIIISNNNDFAVNNIKIKTDIPDDFKIKNESEENINLEKLNPQESKTVTLTLVAKKSQEENSNIETNTAENEENNGKETVVKNEQNKENNKNQNITSNNKNQNINNNNTKQNIKNGAAKTGDNNSLIIWSVILIVSLLVICSGIILKKKKFIKLFSILLGTIFFGSFFYGIDVKASELYQNNITVKNNFKYDEKDYEITVNISYEYEIEEEQPKLELSSNISEFLIQEDKQVLYIYAKTESPVENIELYEKGNNEKIADMLDDGAYSQSGDDIPNDGIYSAKILLNPTENTQYEYYAIAKNGEEEINSNNIVVYGYLPMQEENFDEMEKADEELQQLLSSEEYKKLSIEEKVQKVEEKLQELANSELIIKESIYYDNESKLYTFSYKCGVYGSVMVGDFNDELDTVEANEETSNDIEETTEILKESESEKSLEENTSQDVLTEEVSEENSTEEEVSGENSIKEEASEEEANEEEANKENISVKDDEDIKSEEKVLTDDKNEINNEKTTNFEETKLEENNPQKISKNLSLDAQKTASQNSSIKAKILYSRDEASSTNDIYQKWVGIKNKLEENNVKVNIDSDVTIEDYKTAFSGNDLVLVHSHGSRQTYRSGFLWLTKNTYSVVCLRDESTKEKDKKYKEDLQQHRILKATTGDGTFYWVFPSFFNYYYSGNKINDAIVYMGMCLGFGEGNTTDYTLGKALTDSGAAIALGYRESVYTYYNVAMAEEIVNQLIDGKTIGESINEAMKVNGKDDVTWGQKNNINEPGKKKAVLQSTGNKEKILFNTGILNGSFEESANISTSKWSNVGDARILQKLAELKPVDGSRMAIITTGLGSAEESYINGTEGSSIYQYFKVPVGTKSLTFSYDIISEEPMEYVGSMFDDKFVAELLDEKGNVITQLTFESVNTSQWYEIDGINFDGGDNTTYHTKWKTVTNKEISKYSGKFVTLRFSVWDTGDSIYDTAVLIDSVSLK